MTSLVEHATRSLASATLLRSKLTPAVLSLQGMSAPRNRHLLNNLCSLPLPALRYLEIGPWRGASYISALYNNLSSVAYHACIDNFTEDPEGAKDDLVKNATDFLGENVLNLIEADCFSIDPLRYGLGDINLLFYDGCHTREAQYRALVHFHSALADHFILVVDDWNWGHVRQATRHAIADLELDVLFHAELFSNEEPPLDRPNKKLSLLTGLPLDHISKIDGQGWWNGVFLAVCRKRNRIPV